MKFRGIGRLSMALAAAVALGLGMTACGGGTIGYMWVAGTVSTSSGTGAGASQIVGFKIDDYTGNLTTAPLSPYTSQGSNPANILVRPGGRYVYVVNTGTTTTNPDGTVVSNGDGNVAEFSVGGDGRLTFQNAFQTQGNSPIWASLDSSGSFLYVLDRLAPAGTTYNAARLGDITAFQIDPNTGRLSLLTNAQIKDQNDQNLNYFPVGPGPTMTKLTAAGCLYVLDKNQATDLHPTSIFPYQISNGQLVQATNTQIQTGASNLSSINTGGGNGTGTGSSGSNIYATDIGPQNADMTATTPGQVFAYTVGTNCSLNAVSSSPFANSPLAQNPVWAQLDTTGKFLYVLNQSNSSSQQQNSSVTLFTTDSTGKLTVVKDANNPYPTGAGPTCIAEDPTNQYLYISNSVSGNVVGKGINSQTGQLNDLRRGSTFSAVTHASCLAISGSTN